MRPTILCFSHLCNQTYITGAEKHLLFMLRELSARFRCVLVVPQEGMLSEQAVRSEIHIAIQPCPLCAAIVDPFPDIEAHLEWVKPAEEWKQFIALMHQFQPDYVLVNTSVHVWPAAAASSLGIPVLWQITECISDNGYAHLSVSLMNRYADAVIGCSNTVLSPFQQEHLSNPKTSRFLLPPSWHMADLQPELWQVHRSSLREQLGVRDTDRLVGYMASSLTAAKGLEHFVRMALSIAETYSDCQFLLVGEPVHAEYMAHCRSLIEKSDYAHRFHSIRFVSRIQAAYAGMDIVVIPSLILEGFGMTAMEGLVFGKGVLTYRSGGLGEIMDTIGRGRYAVDMGDVSALVYQLDQWLTHPEQLAEEQRHNEAAVTQAYGIDTYRERLHRLWVEWIQQQGQLFAAVRGSASAVYIRTDEGYRRVVHKKTLKQYGNPRIRCLPDEVLLALPFGAPLAASAVTSKRAAVSHERASLPFKRRGTGSRTGRLSRGKSYHKQRNGIGKKTRTKVTRGKRMRAAKRRHTSRDREHVVPAGSKRRSIR